jgi:carboxylesterase type B
MQIQHVGSGEIDKTNLLPVIVFVHGGGFNAYWGSVFGGQRLLNRDVVLVTLNYR